MKQLNVKNFHDASNLDAVTRRARACEQIVCWLLLSFLTYYVIIEHQFIDSWVSSFPEILI